MEAGNLRERLKGGRPLLAGWASLGTSLSIELMGRAGFDLVVIDQQHGVGGSAELLAQLTAARAARLPALVRVPTNEPGVVGRALDAGAQGVVCPMIDSANDAARFVAAVKYPPIGERSWGAFRANPLADFDYAPDTANEWTIACVQIETRGAMENLDAILAVPGVDMALAGPNDLAIAMTGQPDIRAPEVLQALDTIHERCRCFCERSRLCPAADCERLGHDCGGHRYRLDRTIRERDCAAIFRAGIASRLEQDAEKSCPGLDPGCQTVFGRHHAQITGIDYVHDLVGSTKSHPDLVTHS